MNVIETRGLTKRYRRKLAVDNLDMAVAAGDIYGFVGKNGSGKSTTMKMVCGLAHPTSGEVTLFGNPANDLLALVGLDPTRKDEQLATAAARLAAMSGLLDELFSYARAADPDTPLELVPVPLRPLLEQVLLGHYPEFEERGWEPELVCDGAPVVSADPEALARIAENLVANALRHGSGPLSVTVRPAGEKSGAVAIFSNPVADASAIDADRLFERFYRVDAARSTAGSGLGLATAAELAAAQGMRLSARVAGDELVITLAMETA